MQAHEADDWNGEFAVEYSGQKNIVVRCPDCGTEKGERVLPSTTIGPSRSVFSCCNECQSWKGHYPVREAERGEYDADHICDGCNTMYDNTMDADLCCNDDCETEPYDLAIVDA